MHFVMVSSNEMVFVQDWGKGLPIVFIAGWPFDHRCYEYQFNQIPEQGYRCIGIDMRGFGRSNRPWNNINYDTFADDIHQVCKELDLRDAILVGHSMGGAISIRYVAKYNADRIAGLVLLGAAAPIWTQRPDYLLGSFTQEEVNELLDLCYRDRPQLLANFSKMFFRHEDSVSKPFANWLQNIGLASSGHATAKCLEQLRDTDLRPDLPKINIPTLILHSPHDKVCPFDFANELKKGIKDATIVKFENSGHGLFCEEYKKCNNEIIKFANLCSQRLKKAA